MKIELYSSEVIKQKKKENIFVLVLKSPASSVAIICDGSLEYKDSSFSNSIIWRIPEMLELSLLINF